MNQPSSVNVFWFLELTWGTGKGVTHTKHDTHYLYSFFPQSQLLLDRGDKRAFFSQESVSLFWLQSRFWGSSFVWCNELALELSLGSSLPCLPPARSVLPPALGTMLRGRGSPEPRSDTPSLRIQWVLLFLPLPSPWFRVPRNQVSACCAFLADPCSAPEFLVIVSPSQFLSEVIALSPPQIL